MSAVNTMDKLLLQVLMEWGREHKPGDKLWRKRCKTMCRAANLRELGKAKKAVLDMITAEQHREIVERVADAAEAGTPLPGQEQLKKQVVAQLRGDLTLRH